MIPLLRTARLAMTLAALLAGGVAVNLIVAWSCARWGDHRPSQYIIAPTPTTFVPPAAAAYLNDPTYLHRNTDGTPSPLVASTPQAGFSLDPVPASSSEFQTGLDMEQRGSLVSTRISFTRWLDSRFMGNSRTHAIVQFGFPFRSMQYAERSRFGRLSIEGAGGVRVPGWQGGWPFAPSEPDQRSWNYRFPARIYPLTPLPRGFAAGAALYAIVLSALVGIAQAIRRRLRFRHGLCRTCGYPVGVSPVCTECGAALARRACRTTLAARLGVPPD